MKVYLPYTCNLNIMSRLIEQETGRKYNYAELYEMVKSIVNNFPLEGKYFSAQESQVNNLRYIEIPEEKI